MPDRLIEAKRIAASGNQERYVKAELSGIGSYMIPMGHVVEGRFDEDVFRKAAEALVLRHEALRTSFDLVDGQLWAVVSQTAFFQCEVFELSHPSLAAFRDKALSSVFEDVDPLKPGSLIRFLVADLGDRWRFMIAAHHAITDGFSRGVMNSELLKLYAGEKLHDAKSYYDFSLDSCDDKHASQGAQDYVDALPKPVRIVGDGASDPVSTSVGKIVDGEFHVVPAELRSLSKAIDATQFGVLGAIYGLGLRGFSGEPEISSFFQTEGRKALGAPNSVIGPFSNTLPLDLSADLDQDFASFASEITARTRRAVALENEPVLDLTIAGQKAPSVSINMFPPASKIRAGDLSVGPREFLDRRTEYDLNLLWSSASGKLSARAFADATQLSEDRTGLFLDFQRRLLEAALENPHRKCRDILKAARLGHEAMQHRETLEPDPEFRIHQDFFDWAERSPDTTAIVTSGDTISYGELAENALCIAGGITAAGAGPGDCIIIFAQRDPAIVASMLGVSATGASFALVDSSYPEDRIKSTISQLGARYLIEAGAKAPCAITEQTTVVRPVSVSEIPPAPDAMPARLTAYHLFTSGTTGAPKLVTHPDKTLQRFIRWQADALDLSDPICTVMMAGIAHDPTLRDVFLPLSNGGKIAIPSPSELMDADQLRRLITDAQCNVIRLSATSSRLLTLNLDPKESFEHLKAIFWGGERLPPQTANIWRDLAPGARQFSVFGTTETPQAFLLSEIDETAAHRRDIAIGRALPWTGARLVADDGSTVSIGEVGEIVADLADPIVGAVQKFPERSDKSSCEHYTGDLGYQMQDGLWYYAGRRDWQIKINGFRVELGEIEAFAERVDGVERACAILVDAQIILFVMTENIEVTEKKVRGFLYRSSPAYMMPARIVITDRFPFTPNGKIDRDELVALSALEEDSAASDLAQAPLEGSEHAIATVFAKRTGSRQITRDQSLFDLGADSLSTIEVRLELEALGLTLPDDWQWVSVSDLARHLAPDPGTTPVPKPFSASNRIETFVVVRFLAIVSVVAYHTGLLKLGGASIVLFTIAGYSFSRMQLPAILMDDHPRRVWSLLLRLLVPLVPITLFLCTVNANLEFELEPDVSTWLFYRNLNNFIQIVLLDQGSHSSGPAWLWFIHAYLQMFFFIGVLLSFSGIRRRLSNNTWACLAVFFLLTEAANLIVLFGAAQLHGDLHEVAFHLAYSPTTVLPFLAIGGLVATAQTNRQMGISFGLLFLHAVILAIFPSEHREFWWMIALAVCVFFPTVSLPRMAAKIVLTVAGYSLMIYLSHTSIGGVFSNLAGTSEMAQIANVVVQICCGVALGLAMRPVNAFLNIGNTAQKQFKPVSDIA